MSRTAVTAAGAAPDPDWPRDLIRLSRFASEIGVHVSTVHRWRLDGLKRQPGRKFPAVRIGGVWFVSRKAGQDYIAGGQPNANWLAASQRNTDRQRAARRRRTKRGVDRYLDREGI
jgi:hypothetical protein